MTQIDEVNKLIDQHSALIKTRVQRGKIKTSFHFQVQGVYTRTEADTHIKAIKSEICSGCKLNIAFAFILRNRVTDQLRFYHSSNNTLVFRTPKTISTEADYAKVLDSLDKEDVYEYALRQRPSTIWVVAKIVSVRYDVYKMFNIHR